MAQSFFVHTLGHLHKNYGEVVRVGPNELHCSRPTIYLEIHNNRWDKEETIYHSFEEDRSSFGYLAYEDAKDRKTYSLACSRSDQSGTPRALFKRLFATTINSVCPGLC